MKPRNVGADIFRCLCCLGVLDYHIIDDVLSASNWSQLVYFGASFCVPGFFVLSGYLMAEEKPLDYYATKSVHIMSKLFGWIVFWVICHFIRTNEIYDIWSQFTAALNSDGILPVSWFLFTYAFIVGICAYPLQCLVNKSRKIYFCMIIIWVIAVALDFGKSIAVTKPMSLWLHLYVGYFAVGMIIPDIEELMECLKLKTRFGFLTFVFTGTSFVYFFSVKNAKTYLLPYMYYGKWYYSVWLISLFFLCLELNNITKIYDKVGAVISRVASNTMVVYMAHLPILIYITQVHPLQSLAEAFAMILALFLVTELMAEIFRRVPLLKKLV